MIAHPLDLVFQTHDIIGASLLRGTEELDHRFLARWTPRNHQDFIQKVETLVTGLATNRDIQEIALVYRSIQLMIIVYTPYTLVLVSKRETSHPILISLGREWMNRFVRLTHPLLFKEETPPQPIPEPKTESAPSPVTVVAPPPPAIDPRAWKKFHHELETILSKVLSSSICEPMITRSCIAMGFDPDQGVPPSQFETLGIAVIRQIPNISKQESLTLDFEEMLKRIQP
jgi:hypothetical protein